MLSRVSVALRIPPCQSEVKRKAQLEFWGAADELRNHGNNHRKAADPDESNMIISAGVSFPSLSYTSANIGTPINHDRDCLRGW